ncbi:MAG: site-specific DNA-methyltransferase [Bacteroidetes bacterium]|nr:site-specific DNA-methyltransferase [Bacteroidota bacterium]
MQRGNPNHASTETMRKIKNETGADTKKITINTSSIKYPKSIIKISNEIGLHPTQKPVKLFEYLIKTYTNKNDLVLDTCIGSGTTAVAAKHLKRNFIGIEISEEYCEISRQRLRQEILL